jgi:hypothetical protein
LISATFEGEFPGPWALYDTTDPPTGYVWGKRSCRSFAGSNSAWAVGGGSNGAALACGANYPDNVDSWLDYGPFSTVGISAGQFSTKAWTNTEYNAVDNEPVDTLCRMASIDGANYSGWCLGGDSRKTAGNVNGWIDARVLDLSQVPEVQDDGSIKWINMLGQPRVWVAIVFSSDSSITFDEGAYVDNTVLRLCPSGSSCPGAGPTLAPEANGGVREVAAHMVRPANKR